MIVNSFFDKKLRFLYLAMIKDVTVCVIGDSGLPHVMGSATPVAGGGGAAAGEGGVTARVEDVLVEMEP